MARRTGIVHIRRSTSDAPVYRLALRAYIGQLVANRANLVWSIEGGRSRTGKLRPPRYGLLRYVVDAVEAVDAPEALVVPVSIVYDQLPAHEVSLMVSEARGLGKQPENVRWLLGYARGLHTVSAGCTSTSGSRYDYGSGSPSCASTTRRRRMPSSASRWRCRTGSTGRRP